MSTTPVWLIDASIYVFRPWFVRQPLPLDAAGNPINAVLGFLRFQDFGLMLVMGGAVVVTLLAYKLAPRLRARPLLGGSFHAHPSAWNRDTAVGAALFGVGWGLCGVCPGPAIAGLGTGNWTLLWALGGIALGALVQGLRAR